MMFFRKKEKVEIPVVGDRPQIPPRESLFNMRDGNEEEKSTIGLSKSNIHKMSSDDSKTSSVHTDSSPVQAFGSPKDFNIQGLVLPALAIVQVNVRKLTLQKEITGDFGFSIRRVQFPFGRGGELQTVVFAEPIGIRPGPPRPDDIRSGLLPGDQLVEVEGRRVEFMSREELNETVRNAGQTIELVVKAMPELAEFCDRRRGARDGGDQLMLGHINMNLHEDVPEDQRYWLIHKDGYTIARLIEMMLDSKVRIMVAGREMVVDSTDVDRTNPLHMDRIADISGLRYINETSTIHLLRQRYGSNLLYTNAGSQNVVCIASLKCEQVVQDRLVSLFKGCRKGQMPAHIYATAQQVYRNLQMTSQNQSVLLTGITGSGKTTQLRNFIHYLTVVAGWTHTLSYDKLAKALDIIEAFGHSTTSLHRDSTRFVHLFSLGFDKAAAVRSARVQAFLLEADRVIRRNDGEKSFHVFNYMLEGASEELKDQLHLTSVEKTHILLQEDKESATERWLHLVSALNEFGLYDDRFSSMCSVLAAILHLQVAGATPGCAQRAHFLRASHAQIAADLLRVDVDELTQAVFRGKTNLTGHQGTAGNITRLSLSSRGPDGPEALISFTAALYQELFHVVIDHINKALSANSSCSWISILDYPGSTFHSEWADGKQRAFGLNELVYNYINERVVELFYDISFSEQQEVYSREQVDVEMELPFFSPHAINRLLDQKQQLLTCTDIERRSEERRGLLAILEEESMFPGATDDSLLERIFMHLGDDTKLIHRMSKPRQFMLAHAMNCHPTVYDVSGWVKQAQPCESASAPRFLLTHSKSPSMVDLFGSSAFPSDTSKLRRATQAAQVELSSRRICGGFLTNISCQIDYVFSTLRRATRSHFVHCIQPTAAIRITHDIVDVPFVRSQLRSILLIDSVRVSNRGYPERVPFRDFRRRFSCLVEAIDSSIDDTLDDRAAVSRILEKIDIHQHRYRLGISQVLLASDVLCELEDKRELSLYGVVVAFQRECRRRLATKWLQRRRILETAVRCLQKNGRSYMKVREWAWWGLYTKVIPLLAIARTDLEHREWQLRIRQLDSQLNELRIVKTKLECRVAEIEEELTREAQAAHELSVALERETQMRIQLERRLEQWRDGSNVDGRFSRVPSVTKFESDDKTSELRAELIQAKELEDQLRVKAQHAVTQLQDVETELSKVQARNQTLERKQQRFDSDFRAVEEQLVESKFAKNKAEKERDEHYMNISKKVGEIQVLKTENSELRALISRLRREAEELLENAAGADLSELTVLQKTKKDLEIKIREQEDEMDDLAGQNQMLQQTVTRLEMGAERLKADLAREAVVRETEIDELRGQYQRRLRVLEDQLSDIQETNSSLIKENRVLEARARQSDINNQSYELSGGHYRRELRNALALLSDTQSLLAHEREAAPSQALLRQLREQLEDAEATKMGALKGRHGLESELNEVRIQLEQALVAKGAAEDRALTLLKEKNSGLALIEEKDEQLLNLLKKYKTAVQQMHIDHIAISDYLEQIAELEKSKQKLLEKLNEETSHSEYMQQHTVEKHKLILVEQKLKETETKLDLEIAHKQRLESIVIKLTDEVDSLQEQIAEANCARERESDISRKARKENMQLQEIIEELRKRDVDASFRSKVARDEIDRLEGQKKCLTTELKLANRRIEALQAALSDGLDNDDSDSGTEKFEDNGGAGMDIL